MVSHKELQLTLDKLTAGLEVSRQEDLKRIEALERDLELAQTELRQCRADVTLVVGVVNQTRQDIGLVADALNELIEQVAEMEEDLFEQVGYH